MDWGTTDGIYIDPERPIETRCDAKNIALHISEHAELEALSGGGVWELKIGKQLCTYENKIILAWRVWLHGDEFINKERKPILHSVNLNDMGGHYTRSECPWKAGEANKYPYLFKDCLDGRGQRFDGSQGGIYAYKSYRAAIRDTCHLPGQNVWGGVWLWGKIFEHKYGYRALFAYPAAMCGVGRQARLEAIGARYRIPTMSVWFDKQSTIENRIREAPMPEAVGALPHQNGD